MKSLTLATMAITLAATISVAGFLDYKRYEYDVAWNSEFGDDGPLSSCYFQAREGDRSLNYLASYCVTVWAATYQELRYEY